MRFFVFCYCLLLLINPIFAQDMLQPEVISAKNIWHLQSITQIDFADLDCEFDTGSFALSYTGDYVVVQDARNHVYLWHVMGELLQASTLLCDEVLVPNYIAFDVDDMFYIFQQREDAVVVGQTHPQEDMGIEGVIYPLEGLLLDAWVDAGSIWLEMRDENTQQVIFAEDAFIAPDEYEVMPYAPAQDEEAIVRVGRIPAPYTITSSRAGIVKLWNIQTGAVVYEVDNGTGEASVFGAINHDATHFVWRDNLNEALYLLNFETGENRQIADLNGEYAQWYFLSHDASVAIAVNLGFQPNIVAWDTSTGERMDLGEYRACSRPQPDMARLSADGTTVVIGCDTGLDIWRIIDEEN